MLRNARVTAFTNSEFLMENERQHEEPSNQIKLQKNSVTIRLTFSLDSVSAII